MLLLKDARKYLHQPRLKKKKKKIQLGLTSCQISIQAVVLLFLLLVTGVAFGSEHNNTYLVFDRLGLDSGSWTDLTMLDIVQ